MHQAAFLIGLALSFATASTVAPSPISSDAASACPQSSSIIEAAVSSSPVPHSTFGAWMKANDPFHRSCISAALPISLASRNQFYEDYENQAKFLNGLFKKLKNAGCLGSTFDNAITDGMWKYTAHHSGMPATWGEVEEALGSCGDKKQSEEEAKTKDQDESVGLRSQAAMLRGVPAMVFATLTAVLAYSLG